MEERNTETRSASPIFTLPTVFHVFSVRAYAWLMKTPEYRQIKDDHGTRGDGPPYRCLKVLPLMKELVWFVDVQSSRSDHYYDQDQPSPSLGYLLSLRCVARTAEPEVV